MTEKDSQSNSQNQYPERKFSQEQYEILKRYSDKNDMTDWNKWREENPYEEILLEEADLRYAHLEDAYLTRAHLKYANLTRAHLEGTDLQEAYLEDAYLRYAHLKYVNLTRAHLEGADLQEAHLEHANLRYAHLEHADLTRAHLEGTDLRYAHLEEADLRYAHLEHAYLAGAHLEHADLRYAHLEDANLRYAHLEDANLRYAHLEHSDLAGAHLEHADLTRAHLEGADLQEAYLRRVNFTSAFLQGTNFRKAIVDEETLIWDCKINKRGIKEENYTDFAGVGLDSARIQPHIKQLLEYNIRISNWSLWYVKHPKLKWLVKPFWLMSDYGMSTEKIVFTFFGLALVFANIYYHWARIAPPGLVENLFVDRNGVDVQWWLVPLRTLYFSIVTQTTLGFGDMYAKAQSICGHILLGLQVILGYVLLGALVTRFAVLFTAGGPAGEFTEKS